MKSSLAGLFLMLGLIGAASGDDYFFENVTPDGRQDLAVSVQGDSVVGSMSQTAESGNAYGTFAGEKGQDGIFKVQYAFEIEGSAMTEEMLFKVAEDQLLMGVGELAEKETGQMVLKDPAKVEFSKVFKRLPLVRTDQASSNGAAVARALEAPISKSLGIPVVLNAGDVIISGDWALYDGVVSAASADKPGDKALQEKLANGRLRGFVQRDGSGPWKVVRWGFMTDEGGFEYDTEEGEAAPWQLEEALRLPALWSESDAN